MRFRAPLAIFVASALALGVAACSDDDGGASERSTTSSSRRRATTTTGSANTTSSTSTTTSSTTTTLPPSTSTSTGGGGGGNTVACGAREEPMTQAVIDGGMGPVPVENYTVTACRIAASNEIWGAVDLVPKPGTGVPRLIVVLQRIGALWNVRAYGETRVACDDAPPPVRAELQTGC